MRLFRKKPLEDDLSPEFEGYAVVSIITVSSQLSNLNNKAASSWSEFRDEADKVHERAGSVLAWGMSKRFDGYEVSKEGRGWFHVPTSRSHRATVVRTYCTYGRYKGKVGLWLRPYDQEGSFLWQDLKLYAKLAPGEDALLKNILYDLNRGSYEPK